MSEIITVHLDQKPIYDIVIEDMERQSKGLHG